jgi:hypothetical protein
VETDITDEDCRAAIERQFQLITDPIRSHELYHDDAVLEFPQSGERFEGVANFREWRSQYPGEVEFQLRRLSGCGDVWVRELSVRYDGGPTADVLSVGIDRCEAIPTDRSGLASSDDRRE